MRTTLHRASSDWQMLTPHRRISEGTPHLVSCRALRSFLALTCACLLLAGCDAKSKQGPPNFSGDPKRGMALIEHYGCGGCHLIPQIANAKGNVGPPLLHVGTRTYLAGFISNSPENMARWIQNPQKALPGNAMPQMGVTPQESRDITAFLYTLK
jgi:cytochrome c